MSKVGSFDEMASSVLVDMTKDGKCSGCGECCSTLLPVSSNEIKQIKRYIEKHKILEQKTCPPMTDFTLDMTCPFRSEKERKCLIYPVRPEICRVFQCDQSSEIIRKNKRMLHHKYYVIDMREVFYGRDNILVKMCVDIARRGLDDEPR